MVFIVTLFPWLAEATILEGTYSIPTQDSQLRDHATFEVDANLELKLGKPTLHFVLPAHVVGKEQEFHLEEVVARNSAGVSQWRGPHADGTCTAQGNGVECHLRFEKLDVDVEGLARHWEVARATPDVVEKKLRLARDFGGDPVGVLRYPDFDYTDASKVAKVGL